MSKSSVSDLITWALYTSHGRRCPLPEGSYSHPFQHQVPSGGASLFSWLSRESNWWCPQLVNEKQQLNETANGSRLEHIWLQGATLPAVWVSAHPWHKGSLYQPRCSEAVPGTSWGHSPDQRPFPVFWMKIICWGWERGRDFSCVGHTCHSTVPAYFIY